MRRLRVFVVEDSEVIRSRLVAMLTELRGVVVAGEAGSVADAVAHIPGRLPDAVLVDLRLPDGDGFEVIRAAKALRPPPAVVVLTSYAYPQLRARGFAAGADWFLDKATEFPRIPAILGELQRASAERAR
ncbi:MAG TPA: response regulator transcription factor [Gemmatimonadales bacterium]|nr:response regulator transcription factor [Gemmatimonadales bacterium]